MISVTLLAYTFLYPKSMNYFSDYILGISLNCLTSFEEQIKIQVHHNSGFHWIIKIFDPINFVTIQPVSALRYVSYRNQ